MSFSSFWIYWYATDFMVLLERIELSTSPLPRECSTSELQQRRVGASMHILRRAQEHLDGFF